MKVECFLFVVTFRVNPKLTKDITPRVASACAEDQELKAMAERVYIFFRFL
jgi:hypothetical protein